MPFAVDTQSEDPLTAFSFGLEVQGKIAGFFTEVTGLGSTNEVTEQKLVGPKGLQIVRKIPGRLKWEDMKLKRGITADTDLWDWHKAILDGKVSEGGSGRFNGSVVMYDQGGAEKARWNFDNAWLSAVTGPAPKSDSNDLGIEEATITYEYVKRVQ